MADKFNIQITIDGQDARAEAGRLRKAIEAELGKLSFGVSGGVLAAGVASGKATLKEQERQNKLTSEAQKLTGELGLAWADVNAGMQASGDSVETVIGGLKRMKQEQTAANRVTQQQARLQADAQKLAQSLGLSWDQVEDAMQTTGAELGDVVRELKNAETKQRRIADDAKRIYQEYRGASGTVRLFTEELGKARNEMRGLFELSRDVQEVGNSIRMNFALVAGAMAAASKEYVTFAKQSDVGARSLGLDLEQSKLLRQLTIEQSANLAVLDPETTARGITVWAQATGEQITNQEELTRLLAQTVPIQQVAALSQTDINTVTEATAGALNQYGLQVEETTRVIAIMNKISDDTLVSFGDVAEAFKYVGPMANRVGEPIEATAAAFAILGDNGIRGTMAGTSYGRMLENLLVPNSEKAAEIFEQLYGSASPFFDANEQFLGGATAIDMLAAAMENMTDKQREATIATIFDTNAARSATPLIEAQIEARKQGINVLKQEAEDLSESALAVWEKQLADWEESDVYRVQQAQMRWKAFWLTVGQQGLDAALPYLERGSELIQDLIDTVQANPWLSKTVLKVATGAIAVGTVITAVGTLAKTALTLQTILGAAKTTLLKRQTAEQRFQASVVSAAEQFRAIITQAATQAAGIETQGAVAEEAIETKAAAARYTSLVGAAGLVAAGVVASGVVATLIGQVLEQTGLADRLRGSQDELAALGSEHPNEAAMLRRYGVIIPEAREMESPPGMGDLRAYESRLPVGMGALREYEYAQEQATRATEEHTDALYHMNRINQDVVQLSEEHARAADSYAEMLARQAEALTDFNAQVAELTSDLNADLAQMAVEYQRNRAQEEAGLYADLAKAQQDFQRQQAKAAADHQKEMARMEEDHYMTLWDLSLSRDAAGIYKENQRYQVEKRRADEDFAAQQSEAQQEFAVEQAERQQQHAEKMAEMAAQYLEERDARLADHAEQVAELDAQHQEEMARLDKEYFDKINAELNYYSLSKEQQAQNQRAMLAEAQAFLTANRKLWLDHVATLPAPGPSSRTTYQQYQQYATGYASGGYVGKTGPALVHQGEFVMTAATVRQLEGVMGSLNQAKVGGMGGAHIPVAVSVNGIGLGPREVARLAAQQVETQLLRVLSEVN